MRVPTISVITLGMEIIIGCLIFSIVYFGYFKNIFSKNLSLFVVGYEIIFNVGYMIYRTILPKTNLILSPLMKIVAAFHGALSLVMLFVVVFVFLRANREYTNNINSFALHKNQTRLFVIFWLVSLLSGMFLFLGVYFWK